MLTTLESKLLAGSVVREESRFPVSFRSGWYVSGRLRQRLILSHICLFGEP